MKGRSFRRVAEQQELPGSVRKAFGFEEAAPSYEQDRFASLRAQGDAYRARIQADVTRMGGMRNAMAPQPIPAWQQPRSAESYTTPQMRYNAEQTPEENYSNWSQYDSGRGAVRRVSEGNYQESAIRPNPAYYQKEFDPQRFNWMEGTYCLGDKDSMDAYRARGASLFDPDMSRMAGEFMAHDMARKMAIADRNKGELRRKAEWDARQHRAIRESRVLEERSSPLVAMGRTNRITRTANETVSGDNRFGMMNWDELGRREEMRVNAHEEKMRRKASIKAKDHKIEQVRDAEWELQKMMELTMAPPTMNNAYGRQPGYGGYEPRQAQLPMQSYGRRAFSSERGSIAPVGRQMNPYGNQPSGGSAIDGLLKRLHPDIF